MCRVYLCGILLLLLTSIPQAIQAGAGLGGLIGSIILIGLGVGGVKSSVAPFTGISLSTVGDRRLLADDGCSAKPIKYAAVVNTSQSLRMVNASSLTMS